MNDVLLLTTLATCCAAALMVRMWQWLDDQRSPTPDDRQEDLP
ncbi:hypothetical protein [Roseateles sp.]